MSQEAIFVKVTKSGKGLTMGVQDEKGNWKNYVCPKDRMLKLCMGDLKSKEGKDLDFVAFNDADKMKKKEE